MLINMVVDFHRFFFSLPIHPWEALKNWNIQFKPIGLPTKCSIELLVLDVLPRKLFLIDDRKGI